MTKDASGIDDLVALFPSVSAKMLERLLVRAAEREALQAGHAVRAALGAVGAPSASDRWHAAALGRELGKALRHRADLGRGQASVRRTAPDTGGRPFHFAHSVVSKADAPKTASKASRASAGGGKGGRAAAHMRYIEREVAVERLPGVEVDGPERGGKERARGDGSFDREIGHDGAAHATGAAPGQAYVENPGKLESGEQVLFSFGTIGDRFDQRVVFWEELEKAEAHPSARVQHRLILELPHEATPQARYDIMRTFCARFEADGIPYWAALHAPGAKNDARNFHAHIVYSERPAARMIDPATGQMKWDFAITVTRKKKSRNVVTTRPYRQSKLRSYHDKDFLPKLRKTFADVVNDVLARDEICTADGKPVRYDARSYKNMGVDAVPMHSINRIIADKMKTGQQTVLDGDYTRRMVATELREAAARREKGVIDLVKLDEAVQAVLVSKEPNKDMKLLPREMRGPMLGMIPKKTIRLAGARLLALRRDALQVDVIERATIASLERIVAATAPKAVAAANNVRDEKRRAEAPAPDAAAILHAAALAEIEETRRSVEHARRSARHRIGAALNAWQDLVRAPLPETTPTMRRIIADIVNEPATSPSAAREAIARTPDAAPARNNAPVAQARSQTTPDTSRPGPADAKPRSARTEGATAAPVGIRTPAASPTPPVEQPQASLTVPSTAVGPRPAAATRPPSQAAPAEAPRETPKTIEAFVKDENGLPRAITVYDIIGPLPPRLQVVDARMRTLVNMVRDVSEDPDVRMRYLFALHASMATSSRNFTLEEQAKDKAKRDATEAEASRPAQAPSTVPSQLVLPSLAEPTLATAPPIETVPAAPSARTPLTPSAAAETVESAAPDPTPRASQPVQEPLPSVLPQADRVPVVAKAGTTATRPPALTPAEIEELKRRRKRADDEEKARKKRRAVLAKQNKIKTR